MKAPLLDVRIGGKTVAVPIYKDEVTTLQLVESVNARLRDIEESSRKIDTQAFALQAAFTFAADLARAHEEEAASEGALLQALTRMHIALTEALRGISDISKPA